jgi:hypothetical protein
MNGNITVYGAYGHTGQFVVRELMRREYKPILSGRDEQKLREVADQFSGLNVRVASVDDVGALQVAIRDAAAIINCAGPFVDTAAPLIRAAIAARVHYMDITAEQRAVVSAIEEFDDVARGAGVIVMPALAFYGGLGDLLATAAMGDWGFADDITVAIALSAWHPTRGTRLTGQRNQGVRWTFSEGALVLGNIPPGRIWVFPEPFGSLEVVGLPLSETITISHHLRVRDIRTYINAKALDDIHDQNTPPPTAADVSGRSAQTFVMETVARRGATERRCRAVGRDIYATTAPIVAQAVDSIMQGKVTVRGVVSAGQAFDAADFLRALSPDELLFESSHR